LLEKAVVRQITWCKMGEMAKFLRRFPHYGNPGERSGEEQPLRQRREEPGSSVGITWVGKDRSRWQFHLRAFMFFVILVALVFSYLRLPEARLLIGGLLVLLGVGLIVMLGAIALVMLGFGLFGLLDIAIERARRLWRRSGPSHGSRS
jgi:hypothetical protein